MSLYINVFKNLLKEININYIYHLIYGMYVLNTWRVSFDSHLTSLFIQALSYAFIRIDRLQYMLDIECNVYFFFFFLILFLLIS